MKSPRLILAGSILAALHAHAAVIDWKPTSGDTVWATGSNWIGETAPFNDLTTDIARFNQTSYAFQPSAGTTSITGIEIGDGTTATAALTLSGTALSIGASGITMFANAGAATISSPVTAGAAQIWVNNSANLLTLSGAIAYTSGVTLNGGNIQLNNQTNTGTGGLTCGAGKLIVATSNASNLVAGAAASVLTLSGGTIATSAAGSGGSRTFGNDLLVNGTVQVGDGLFSGGTYTFSGTNQTFNGAVLSSRDNNGVLFTTNPAVLTGDVTVNAPGAGTAAVFTFSGGLKVSGAANANRTMTLNNGAASVTLSGALAGTASGQTITLAGTGTNNVIGAISSGANTPGLIVNGAASGVFIFSTANAFSGGVTLSGGIAEIQSDTGFGTNTLTLSGGSLRAGTTGDRTLANAVTINGPITFASSTASGRAVTLTGNVPINSSPTITFSNTNVTAFTTGTTTLNSDATFQGAGNYQFRNGLAFSANRILTINSTGGGVIRGALAGGGNTLTLSGTGSNFSVGDGTAVTGSTGGIIVNGPAASFATSTSTFTGGVTATSGIVRIGASSTVAANAVTASGTGLGTFTANGGTITGNSNTARTVNNNLAITGDSTFGALGDTTNTALLTFDPTGVTGGTITLTGARTLTVNVGTTFTGPITGGSSPSLAVKGIGTLTLTNAGVASTFGNATIGDTTVSGSLGGRVNPGSQNAMGTGSYTLNYGGTLNPTANFSPTNIITINNGGTYNPTGATAGITAFTNASANSVIGSGGTLNNASGFTLTVTAGTGAAQVSLPAAGVLFNNSNNTVTVTGAYPAFTGAMAFGGTGSNSITTSAATTTSGAQSLAFNQTGGGQMTLNALTIGGNLTVAGSGNSGVSGTIGLSNQITGMLGLVGETGVRSITVNMAPTGTASITNLSTFSGGLTINSGVLSVNLAGSASNTTTKAFTNLAAISLNGGVFRAANNTNNTLAMADSFSIGANGGTIEAMQTNNGPRDQTFSGAITGSGALTLRYGGTGTNSSPVVLAPTSASAYSGAITLATTSGRGRVQFNNNSLAAIAAGGVAVPAGTAFGVDAIATLTGNIGKFTLNTESILALDNLTPSDLDLSAATGINRDIRLGSSGTVTYSGTRTLIPFGNTYKFSPGGGQILIAVTNYVTGANNLDVSAGAIAPGAYGVAANTFASNNAQNYTGTTTVRGIINNSVMGAGATGPTLNAVNVFSAAGATSVTRGATLQLLGTLGSLSGTSGITVQGGGVFQDGDATAANNNSVTDRIKNTASLTLGGSDGGGTFRSAYAAAGTHAQTLASLTVAPGSNTINTTGTSAGTLNLTLTGTVGGAGYDRGTGGVVSVDSPLVSAASGGTITPSNGTGIITFSIGVPAGIKLGSRFVGSGSGLTGASIFVTEIVNATQVRLNTNSNAATVITGTYTSFDSSLTNYNTQFTNAPTSAGGSKVAGDLLVGAFLNNTDFAVAGAAANLAAPSYTLQSGAGSWAANQHITNAANTAFSGTVAGGGLTINSLRSYMGGTVAIGTTGTDSLTIASGMILNTGATTTFSGPGSLTSGNGQDLVFNVQANAVTVNSKIAGNLDVTKAGGSLLDLTNVGNVIKDIYAFGGTIKISNTGALPLADAHVINLMGGTLQFASAGNFTNTSINVGSAGGSMNANANGALSFAGNVTLNGAMTISSPSGGNPTTATYSGAITGPGQIIIGKQSDGKNVTVFTGDNSGWTGGVQFNTGSNAASGSSHVFFRPAVAGYNSAGTGPIVLNAGNTPGGIYFDTTTAGSTTFANDIVNNFTSAPIVAWGLSTGLGTVGTVNTTTLSGKLVGNQGLLLQGYASTNSLISEMVLSGTVSVSGTSGGYSYGTGTFAQNFNNGQGGITLGVTGFRSVTQQGTGNVGLADLPSGQATNGAEGFVRFSGASSFIPGAAGPGFISAIRKAGGGQDGRYGYLLTTGSTYALPEGKSFLIGSLGTGTQQYGTLGVSGTGTNTAILTRSPKLAGFSAGDVNVHANAAGDTQSLNLFARNATDTFQIGTVGTGVVFTPTYGDSGATSAITLMANRIGATTLLATGAGTVDLVNVSYKDLSGVDVTSFKWNLTAGTLRLSSANALGSNSAVGAVTFSGGVLQYTAANSTDYSGRFATTAQPIKIDTNGQSVSFATTLMSGVAGSLTLNDTNATKGTLTLTNANTHTGGTVVNNGTLILNGANTGTGVIRGTLDINSGATVRLESANALGYNTGVRVTAVNINQGTLDDVVNGDQGFNQTYNLTGGTMRSNGGTSNATASQWYDFGPGTAVNSLASATTSTIAGRIILRSDSGNTNTTFTVADGAASTDLLVSAAVTKSELQPEAVGITKAGLGLMQLTGGNTYIGVTNIAQGTLSAGNIVVSAGASNLGNATSAVVLGDATNKGTLSYTGNSVSYTRGFTVSAGGGEIDTTTGGQTLSISGGITSGTDTSLTIGGAGNTTLTTAVALGTTTGLLTKAGAGVLNINSGAQTYATLTTAAGAGVTNVSTAIGTGATTVNANSTMNIYASQTLAALNIADGVEVTFGSGLPFASVPEKPAVFDGVAVVPEPGSLASLSLGLGLLLGLRRRRA